LEFSAENRHDAINSPPDVHNPVGGPCSVWRQQPAANEPSMETSFAGGDFPDDATVICRNNAPLPAFKLISAGRSVSVIGNELDPRLVGVMNQ
jgi:hypothetical protein